MQKQPQQRYMTTYSKVTSRNRGTHRKWST